MEPTASTFEINTGEKNPEAVLNYVLSFEQIDDLRERQRQAYYEAEEQAYNDHKNTQERQLIARAAAQKVCDEYIGHIEESDFFDDDTRKLITGTVTVYSFPKMRDVDWLANRRDDEGVVIQKSGIDLLEEDLASISDYMKSHTPEKKEEDLVLVEAETKLSALRENLAALSAKRQGNIAGKSDDYEAALQEYNTQVAVVGKLKHHEKLADDSRTLSEKVLITAEHFFDEQNKLRKLSIEKFKELPVYRFMNKFAEYMHKGSREVRIAKAVGLGLAIGVVGVAAGAAGASAGVLAVIGVGAAGARFGRAYAMQEAKNGNGIDQLDESIKQEADYSVRVTGDANIDDFFATIQKKFDARLEDDTKAEQAKRRKSMYKAAGATALGVVIGTAGHALVTGGDIWGFGGGNHAGALETPQHGPGIDHPAPGPETHPPVDGHGLPKVEAPQPPEFKAADFNVESGHGYTDELRDFAAANGHPLSPDRSWQLHEALVNQFGQHYIDIAGSAKDVYQMPGNVYNVGLASAGEAHWDPGVAEFIKNWMTARGEW